MWRDAKHRRPGRAVSGWRYFCLTGRLRWNTRKLGVARLYQFSVALKRFSDRGVSDERGWRSRSQSLVLTTGSAVLGAITTILLAITRSDAQHPQEVLRIIAIISSGAVSIVSALSAFFRHNDYWRYHIKYRQKLFLIRDKLDILNSRFGGINRKQFDGLYFEYLRTKESADAGFATIQGRHQ